MHIINTKCCISSAESCISPIAQQLYIIKLRELAYFPIPLNASFGTFGLQKYILVFPYLTSELFCLFAGGENGRGDRGAASRRDIESLRFRDMLGYTKRDIDGKAVVIWKAKGFRDMPRYAVA